MALVNIPSEQRTIRERAEAHRHVGETGAQPVADRTRPIEARG